MNFTKDFKSQMIMVALGACLLLTGRAYSQEIVNTDFGTPATSVGGNFNTAAPAAVNTAAANTQAVYTPAAALSINANNDVDQLSVSTLPRESAPLLAIAIVLVGCAIAKKVSDNRRKERNNKWNSASPRNKAAASSKYYVLHS